MFHWSLPLVIKKFQIWRLVTNFCFLGRFSFPFVVRMMMMCVPSRPVPSRPERRRPTASATGTDDVGPSIPEIYLFLPVVTSDEKESNPTDPIRSPADTSPAVPTTPPPSPSARYGVFLEQQTFAGRTADFLWMLLITGGVLLPVPTLFPSVSFSPFAGASLAFALLYLWSRENPNANTSIMGMVSMKAFYLPWGMMALTMVMGGSVVPDFLGVMAGHLYYFLAVLNPAAGGPRVVRTPGFIHALVKAVWGIRRAPGGGGAGRGAGAGAAPAPRSFGGRGRRLGAD
jgi:Derlin-2/3